MSAPIRHILSSPRADRNRRHWLVLASGPTRIGWENCAELIQANVFAVNGGILSCPNPSAYLCTDKVGVSIFGAHQNLPADCDAYIGQAAVEAANDGSYTIAGRRVRTAAQWAIYLSLSRYHATRVDVFGVSGYEDDGSWQTISTVGGQFDSLADRNRYRATARQPQPGEPTPHEAVICWPRQPNSKAGSNVNAARLMVAMAIMFPAATIRLRGDGPVQRLIRKRRIPTNLELDLPNNMEVP
jgi:hypothetical protein